MLRFTGRALRTVAIAEAVPGFGRAGRRGGMSWKQAGRGARGEGGDKK